MKANNDNNNNNPVRVVNKISPPHTNGEERKPRGLRVPQYTYMKAPGISHDFQVGDTVEVFCDHEKNKTWPPHTASSFFTPSAGAN